LLLIELEVINFVTFSQGKPFPSFSVLHFVELVSNHLIYQET
jgi:hypothetical protein